VAIAFLAIGVAAALVISFLGDTPLFHSLMSGGGPGELHYGR
jgi:hypothetical protein